MATETTSGRRRLTAFALSEGLRTARLRFHRSLLYRPRYAGPTPDRLLIAPTDLRTSDATLAHDIYAGRYVFAGSAIDTGGVPVFAVAPPSDDWARELHGFGWLRHLRASDLAVSRSNARSLVRDWIRQGGRNHPLAWEPGVVARRVLSWLSQSPLVLEAADHAFYRRFMRTLMSQIRLLRRIAADAPAGLPRLRIQIALTAAAVTLPDQDRFLRQASRQLETELERQILPDGGHIGRNPAAVLDILADVLPLRQAFIARDLPPPQGLLNAIDRMMPMVRFFRHGDGTFARFNGAADTPVDLVATVLAYDDARGQPVASAPHSGYERVTAGSTVLIVDTGKPPPIALSAEAHAGCLSFELSSGRQRVIVNCGSAVGGSERLRRLSRTTAAHSTAAIDDSSSCRFVVGTAVARRFGEVILEGPENVPCELTQDEGGMIVSASHDGYVDRFGYIHERRLRLSPSGHRLDGNDRFLARAGRPSRGKDSYEIRFHLPPGVNAKATGEPGHVLLTLPDGEVWQFAADLEVAIEESIYFSETHGNRRTRQLVVNGRPQQWDKVSWWLQRTSLPPRRPSRPPGTTLPATR